MALAGELAKYIGNELVKTGGKELAKAGAKSALSSLVPSVATKVGTDLATKAGAGALNKIIVSQAPSVASKLPVLTGNAGKIPLYRGIKAETPELLQQYIDDMMNPNIKPRTYEGSAYGEGYYFTPFRDGAEGYASNDLSKPYQAVLEISPTKGRFLGINKANQNRPVDFTIRAENRGVSGGKSLGVGQRDYENYLKRNGILGNRVKAGLDDSIYVISDNDALKGMKVVGSRVPGGDWQYNSSLSNILPSGSKVKFDKDLNISSIEKPSLGRGWFASNENNPHIAKAIKQSGADKYLGEPKINYSLAEEPDITLYHGTPNKFEDFDDALPSVWFSDSDKNLRDTGLSIKGGQPMNIMERQLPKDLKIADEDLADRLTKQQLQDRGYAGIAYTERGPNGDETYYEIFSPNKTLRKMPEVQQSLELSPIVADENGVAKTFYHGSPSMDITDFDINMAGKNTRSGERAIWFTDDYPTAEEFSYERIPGDTLFADKRGAKGKVYERNLGLENPLDLSNLSDKQIEELYNYADSRMAFDGKENFIRRMKEFRDAGNDQLIKSQLDMKKLSNSEYDGIVAKMYPGENEVREIGVFDPRKIKNVDKPNAKSPTTELSPQQQEFFKDSVVRDENGELMPMYHGSNNKFSVFDLSKSGKSNTLAQVGFWFTPNEKGAKKFADSIWYGDEPEANVFKTYLNIKNPKVYTGVDNSSEIAKLEKQIDSLKAEQDKALSDMVSSGRMTELHSNKRNDYVKATEKLREVENKIQDLAYGDPYELFKSDIYAMEGKRPYDANVAGIGSGLENSLETTRKFVEKLKSEGYDGIVIKNTSYDSDTLGGKNDQYVVFDPDQIKNVDNLNPTNNPDIRYATGLGRGSSGFDDSIERIGSEGIPATRKETLPDGWDILEKYLGGVDKRVENAIGKAKSKITKKDLVQFLDENDYDSEGTFSELWQRVKDAVDDMTSEELNYAGGGSAADIIQMRQRPDMNNIEDVYMGNKGHTGRLDAEYSDRLGISKSTTPMSDKLSQPLEYAQGDYGSGVIGLDRTWSSGEAGVSNVAHERFHAWQEKSRGFDYPEEFKKAFEELEDEIIPLLHNKDEISKYWNGRNTDYYFDRNEQEARMVQDYLEYKNHTKRYMGGRRKYEYDERIIKPFDKFYAKLRELSKKGIAIPALAGVFGLGALANKKDDKSVDNIK